MADSRPRGLSPDEVAGRVGAILAAAERDARAIIDAARREVPAGPLTPEDPHRPPAAANGLGSHRDSLSPSVGAVPATRTTVTPELRASRGDAPPSPTTSRGPRDAGSVAGGDGLTGIVDALAKLDGRLDALEAKIDSRIDVLWRALSPGSRTTAGHPAPASPPPRPGSGNGGSVGSPTRGFPGNGGPVAHHGESEPLGRAERVRAIDLALRGYTREQIANELRGSMTDVDLDRLFAEVLEHEHDG